MRYRDYYTQMQRDRNGESSQQRRPITARDALGLLAITATICIIPFWYGLFSTFTANILVCMLGAAGMAIAPPALMAFVIPWSPGAMLMTRILGKTWGSGFVVGSACFLIYWTFELLMAWWSAQQGAASAGVAFQMTILFIILLDIIPALLWSPVLAGDLKATLKEEQLVQEYELFVKGKMAVLRGTLMRAHTLTAKGIGNLVASEREELAGMLVGIVQGMENIQQELGGDIREMADWTEPFDGVLEDNKVIRENLHAIADELTKGPINAPQLPSPNDDLADPNHNLDDASSSPAAVPANQPGATRQLHRSAVVRRNVRGKLGSTE